MNIKNSEENVSKENMFRTYGSYLFFGKKLTKFDRSLFHPTAGRLAVVGGLIVFLCCYIYGIAAFGMLWGIALGWLPALVIAWGATHIFALALRAVLS